MKYTSSKISRPKSSSLRKQLASAGPDGISIAAPNHVLQLVKKTEKKPKKKSENNEHDSDLEIFSDFEDNNTDETLRQSYKSGKLPKKETKQMESVKFIRKKLKEQKTKRNDKRFIKKLDLQKVLAEANLKYSPENTIALSVPTSSNDNATDSSIVTKMGGVVPNYLKRLIRASNISTFKQKSNKNEFHAEKKLSSIVEKNKKSDLIVNKPRCEHCEEDSGITDVFKKIYDRDKN